MSDGPLPATIESTWSYRQAELLSRVHLFPRPLPRYTAPMQLRSKQINRVLVLALGWIFILLGIVGLALPVLQGVLFILIGLYLLSRESRTARRLLVYLRRRYPTVNRKLESIKKRAGNLRDRVTGKTEETESEDCDQSE